MAKRTNNAALHAMAERMFVEDGFTAKAVAESLGVTAQTIGRWRKGIGNKSISWDEKRKQFLSAPHNLKKILMQELTEVANGSSSSIDVKALADINKVLTSLSNKVSTQIVYSVFREFDNWMADQDPEIAISFLEWHKQFLLHKAQQES